MGVLSLFTKQKVEQGLEYVEHFVRGVAQNAFFGRDDLIEFFTQKNEMTSPFKMAAIPVTNKQLPYELMQQ